MSVKIHPEDYNKNHGSLGIKLPINSNKKKSTAELFNLSYTTEEQAVSNYVNLLLTKSGERYMQPEFGVGLYFYIFENNTGTIKKQLESEIREQASRWLPYIINDDIIIKDFEEIPGDSKHAINIIIRFRVTESGANKEIQLYPGLTPGTIDVEIR